MTLQILKNVGSPKTKKKLNTLKTKYFFFFREKTSLIMILRAIILQKIVFLADATCKVKLTWKIKPFSNDTQYQKSENCLEKWIYLVCANYKRVQALFPVIEFTFALGNRNSHYYRHLIPVKFELKDKQA